MSLNPEARHKVIEKAFHQGLLVLGCGESTVRLMPPLIIEREHADIALEILDGCLSEVEKGRWNGQFRVAQQA